MCANLLFFHAYLEYLKTRETIKITSLNQPRSIINSLELIKERKIF